jgi:hypothetical protein
VVGPTLTAVLSGISSYQEHSAQQRKAAEAKAAAEPKTDIDAANMESQGFASEVDQAPVSEHAQQPATETDEGNKKAAE